MTDILVDAGIKGIWNFSAIDIDVPDDVTVESANFSNTFIYFWSNPMNDKYNKSKVINHFKTITLGNFYLEYFFVYIMYI